MMVGNCYIVVESPVIIADVVRLLIVLSIHCLSVLYHHMVFGSVYLFNNACYVKLLVCCWILGRWESQYQSHSHIVTRTLD